MWKGKTVSVVSSTHRDVHTIRSCIEGLFDTGVVDEVLIVDNNSEEGTLAEIEKTNAVHVSEERQGLGFGFHRALMESSGDLIITIEVDGTYEPNDILKLLVYSDDFDIVCGTRTSPLLIREGAEMGFMTRWANVLYAKLIEILFNTSHLSDVGCIYRLINRNALDSVKDKPLDGLWAYNLDLMLYLVKTRVPMIEIPLNFQPRGGQAIGAGLSKFKAAGIAMRMFGIILKHLFKISGRKQDINRSSAVPAER